MKRYPLILNTALYFLLLFTSCNNDVFVDELKTSVTELRMNGNGDSATVNLNGGDWRITSVDQPDNPTANQFYGEIYDENGKIISGYDISFYQHEMLKGKLVYDGLRNGFTVSRLKDASLDIHLDENLNDSVFKFSIWVSNFYKSIPINIIQSASDGYVFDHITYTYIPGSYWTYYDWVKDSINNEGNSPVTVKWSVFSGTHQTFAFSSKEKHAFSYLKTDSYVEIPVCLEDSVIKLSSEKKCYKQGKQMGNLPFDDINKTITIPAGISKITKIFEYEHFEASYTLYVRNKKTNEIKNISGIFHSDMPTGKDYYILLKN